MTCSSEKKDRTIRTVRTGWHAWSVSFIIFLCVVTGIIFFTAQPVQAADDKNNTVQSGISGASTSTRVSSEEMDARSDMDLADTLNMVPGMSASLYLGGATEFSMRGYGQDRVAVLVDGIPINDAYEAKADISRIPVAGISHIIINRGVSSALYGTFGTIGSINIITKKPDAPFTELALSAGRYDNQRLSFSHGAPMGNLYYWFTGSVHRSGGYRVSGKLDKDTRRDWFDRAFPYNLYGKSFNDISLKAADTWLNDTGLQDHFGFTRYQFSARAGYSLSRRSEAGLSVSYNNSERKSSSFDLNLFSSYDEDTRLWSDPQEKAWDTDGKDAIFQNQARSVPEDWSVTMTPYYSYRGRLFRLRASAFVVRESDTLRAYATTDHSVFMNPASVYYWDSVSEKAKPYFENPFDSIFTETSLGFQLLPSFRFSRRHKLHASLIFREDMHREGERAIGDAADIIAVHGTGLYETKYLGVQSLTLGVEEEIEPVRNLALSLGISYDAQNLTDHMRRSTVQDTLNEYVDGYLAREDSTFWGTRDSFNPVAGVLYQAMPGVLILRAAGSMKTSFPTLKAYSRISDIRGDLGIRPERSWNGNAGIEFRLLKESVRWRTDVFYSRFEDKIVKAFNEELGGLYSVNIDGALTRGIESILTGEMVSVAGMEKLSFSFSYTFLQNENLDNSPDERLNMGDGFAESPRHLVTFDVRMKFRKGTALSFFGTFTADQFIYVMRERPQTDVPEEYSTVYFSRLRLHDPLFLNIRLSQCLQRNTSLYILCRNVLDEYRANPFNPGPGRTCYAGGKLTL